MRDWGRPQALYVIVPAGESLQLYRGAVLTYREFRRPNNQALEDAAWRELIAKGRAPPPPPFTMAFYAQTSLQELLRRPHALCRKSERDFDAMQDVLWRIRSCANESDLRLLIEAMARVKGEQQEHAVEGLAEVIAPMPWESHQERLIELLASSDRHVADAAAVILLSRPSGVNAQALLSKFASLPPRARRMGCVILSRLPQQTDAMRQCYLQALRDRADGVRWQAALAIYTAGWNDAQSQAALLETLNDRNELVGAAAAYALAKLGVTNAGPILLAKLKECAKRPLPPLAELPPHAAPILEDTQSSRHYQEELLEVDGLASRIEYAVPPAILEDAPTRKPFRAVEFPAHHYTLADALIGALADLGYAPAIEELFRLRASHYEAQATFALARLAPDRLADALLATARDKQIDSYLREHALATLTIIDATNRVRDLIPLLEDTTPIHYDRPPPGPPVRICDVAAREIAILLRWLDRLGAILLMHQAPGELLRRAKEWAQTQQ